MLRTTNANHGPVNPRYLNRIKETIDKTLAEYPRTLAIRMDGYMPTGSIWSEWNFDTDTPKAFARDDTEVVKRFIAALTFKIKFETDKKAKKAGRVHPCRVRYAWVKEYTKCGKPHYHFVLLLNKDRYFTLGNYANNGNNLASKIVESWCIALGLDPEHFNHLINFPDNPCYHLNKSWPEKLLRPKYEQLLYRVSYLAKEHSKLKVKGQRNFGCSSK